MSIDRALESLMKRLKRFWHDMLNLTEGLDKEGTILYIKNNRQVRGANAWLLMSSIMIASLGLEKESPAIIIGAMLISPLMSPILGVGFSIAINDTRSLGITLRHFFYSIIIALVTSSVYFYLTPLEEFNSEIASRIRPDLRDSLIGIFGGVAGIISISRKDISNAIPGVAIATALMPPLCVAGFGIANANFDIFKGSIYLFFLNSFFIALSTYFITRFLGFEIKKFQDRKERVRTHWVIAIVSTIIILPSAFILSNIIRENRYKATAKYFVEDHFNAENVLAYEAIPADSLVVVRLFGLNMNESEVRNLEYQLNQIQNQKYSTLKVLQETNPGAKELSLLRKQYDNVNAQLSDYYDLVQKQKEINERLIKKYSQSFTLDTATVNQITKEALVFFPQIDRLEHGQIVSQNDTGDVVPVVKVHWTDADMKEKEVEETSDKLKEFLAVRLQLDTLLVLPAKI